MAASALPAPEVVQADLGAYFLAHDPFLFDGEHFYFAKQDVLYRASRRGGSFQPFARDSPGFHIDTLQFADQRAVFWTNRRADQGYDGSLVRADKRGGAPHVLGDALVFGRGRARDLLSSQTPRLEWSHGAVSVSSFCHVSGPTMPSGSN